MISLHISEGSIIMKNKSVLAAILIIVLCVFCVGCKNDVNEKSESDSISEAASTEKSDDEPEKVKYIYQTKYVDFEFVPDEQKSEWKSALVSLLNNEKTPVYEKGGGLDGYSYLYPDRPCIENGYQLALFDINTDGTPELLVNAGGGSVGNAFYYVYDIMSGEEIGTLNGGHSDSWCIYFNRSTGKFESIGQFEWRNGWMGKIRLVNKAIITDAMGRSGDYLHETNLMCAYYMIGAVETELTDEETGLGYQNDWSEVYNGVRFWVNEDSATIEAYFKAQDNFTENYIRIAETGIQLIDWHDVVNDDDSVAVKAEKMADALVSSGQKFVKPMGK